MKETSLRILILLFSLLFVQTGLADSLSPMHTIALETPKGVQSWKVELASDDASRSKGLMFRTKMENGKGMLFRFDDVQRVSMWMRNTFIPLDMIFIKNDGTVSSIAANTTPRSLDIISSTEPVRFVLEINAGQAAEFGVEAGQVMQHPWFGTP